MVDVIRTIVTKAATRMPAMPPGGMGLFPGKSGDTSTVADDVSTLLIEAVEEAGTISLGGLGDAATAKDASKMLVLA